MIPKNMFRIALGLFSLVCCATASIGASDPELPYLGHLKLASSVVEISEVARVPGVPWEIAWGPDGKIWFTQQQGTVSRLDPKTGEIELLLTVPDLFYRKSLGLLSMVLHPRFAEEPYVFLHHTYRRPGPEGLEELRSRVVRYRYSDGALTDWTVILDAIPGRSYHNGSRMVIGPDEKLYLSTGDAGEPHLAQDTSVLNGKILRLNLDGAVPEDNPIPGSPVWTWGHRNPQGLVFASNGKLYASEHGPNNDDEINWIRKGHNYGWPDVMGFLDTPDEIAYGKKVEITEPLRAWTPTIATAGLDYYGGDVIPEWKNCLLVVNMKGRALRVLQLSENGEAITSERIYFQKRFGRMRDLCVSPNGDVYLATTNTDWHPRFQPWMYDSLPDGEDRIIRLHKVDQVEAARLAAMENAVEIIEDPEPLPLLSEDWSFPATDEELEAGQQLYMIHCATCHSPEGVGSGDLLPPLAGTDWVTGDKSRLIQTVLHGLSGPVTINGAVYDQEMPAAAQLSDEEIAAVLTFIRKSFGNDANAVIPGEVYEERKATR